MPGTGRIKLVREGDRSALRALFSEHIQAVYAHARAYTGEEETAKAALKKTLAAAQAAHAECPDEPLPWLCSLCDEALRAVPASAAAEGNAAVETPAPACETPVENTEEIVEKTMENPQAEAETSPQETEETLPAAASVKPETVSCAYGADNPASKYDIEQDAWLNELREKKRRALQETELFPAECVENCEKNPPAVENSVETEDYFPKEKQKLGIFSKIGLILLVLVILLLLWAVIGLLMNMEVIPFADLGYRWFNTHILDMF